MSDAATFYIEATQFLGTFDLDDDADRLELIEGIGNFADGAAMKAGAGSFQDLQDRPNVLTTTQFLNLTSSEFEAAQSDENMPEAGWFAILHLLGLRVIDALPKDRDVRQLVATFADLYGIFRMLVAEEAAEQGAGR